MVTFGISTWSINRTLKSGAIALLEVPARLRLHGLTDLQICHFHLPNRESAYLGELRSAIEEAGVHLDAMLLDFGDLSHPENADHDAAELETWLETAAQLGAKHARIAAGDQLPDEATLSRSARHLARLADVGERLGVRVVSENWHRMMPGSAEVVRLLELTSHRVPLCFDFGNWSGPDKYDELRRIAPSAVTVHAKCAFSPGNEPDVADFQKCLTILKEANYAGTIALIYDGPSPEEWRYLDEELRLARSVYPA